MGEQDAVSVRGQLVSPAVVAVGVVGLGTGTGPAVGDVRVGDRPVTVAAT